MHTKIVMLLLSCCLYHHSYGQKKQYKIVSVGFYNLENLFDTIDDPDNRGDDEFIPTGSKNWNREKYAEKLGNLGRVVSELGTDYTPDGVAILGVAEIENVHVLEDLVQHPILEERNYQIIHFDSPDHRGIDVGLLYQPKYFRPLKTTPISMKEGPSNHGDTLFTRDILYVSGLLDGDTVHILVNHWPSRSGGESATTHLREYAAYLNKKAIDELYRKEENPKIILMGDLNDDPVSPSLKKVLGTKRKKHQTSKRDLFNPMYDLYRKGIGTNAWRDTWNLFDQLVISGTLVDEEAEGYRYYQTSIHNEKYLTQKSGRYQGYPFRTFAGDNYQGGYSDHFPVYLYLIKEW